MRVTRRLLQQQITYLYIFFVSPLPPGNKFAWFAKSQVHFRSQTHDEGI